MTSLDDPAYATAFAVWMDLEGGYCNDPGDPGGPTKYGVSLRYARDLLGDQGISLDIDGDGDVDAADIKGLTEADAARAMRPYWDWAVSLGLPQGQTAWAFLFAGNAGRAAAIRCYQRAARACGAVGLGDDGKWGAKTAAASVPSLNALREAQAGFYRLLAAKRPELNWALKGWLNRAYEG